MIKYTKTDCQNLDFKNLDKEFNEYLKIADGDDYLFYLDQNKTNDLKHVIVVYNDEVAIACGALKHFDDETIEMKRVFVKPTQRGLGIASKLLKKLENWAIDLGYLKCILETGSTFTDAITLYGKNGYSVIPNYKQYENLETSICFSKNLKV